MNYHMTTFRNTLLRQDNLHLARPTFGASSRPGQSGPKFAHRGKVLLYLHVYLTLCQTSRPITCESNGLVLAGAIPSATKLDINWVFRIRNSRGGYAYFSPIKGRNYSDVKRCIRAWFQSITKLFINLWYQTKHNWYQTKKNTISQNEKTKVQLLELQMIKSLNVKQNVTYVRQ